MTRAKKFGLIAGILTFISVVLNVFPILWAAGAVYAATGVLVAEKLAVTGALLGAGILTVLTWFTRVQIKSKYLIIISALCLCMDSFVPFLLVLTGAQLVDEVIIQPFIAHCRKVKQINKEIDRR